MAEILIIKNVIPFVKGEYLTYKWVGDPSDTVTLPWRLAKDVPFDLEQVEAPYYQVPFQTGTYYRVDAYPSVIFYRLSNAKVKIGNSLRGIQARLIATLTIWGIGYIEPGQIIGWYCLKQKHPFR